MGSEIFSLLGNSRSFKGQVPCQIKSVEICRGLFSLALKRLPTAGKKYRTPAPSKAYLATLPRSRHLWPTARTKSILQPGPAIGRPAESSPEWATVRQFNGPKLY